MIPLPEPDVFFLPLAVAEPERFRGLDAWTLARRIPDFLHHIVNGCEVGPTGMLEVQAGADETRPARWVDLREPPAPAEAFEMLPEDCAARAVVTGTLQMQHEGLVLSVMTVHRETEDWGVKLELALPLGNPVPALVRLALELGRLLELEVPRPAPTLLTNDGEAFFRFLAGLDGTAMLSGDLEVELREDAMVLLEPYVQALHLDPGFGLALRAAHFTLAHALEIGRVEPDTVVRLLDALRSASPTDGEACVQVAEFLSGIGEEAPARGWLELACELTPPPPRALEDLGLLCEKDGELAQARALWCEGVELDGHPNFFAHLARLRFADKSTEEGWALVLRGLQRLFERVSRAAEWEDEGADLGLLLRELADHVAEHEPPEPVIAALLELRSVLTAPEDHLDLGHCLRSLGLHDAAREELTTGLGDDLDPHYRDEGIRGLLSIEVRDFDRRFARAVDELAGAADPTEAVAEMESFLAVQPEFWPALFFKAMGAKRLGDEELALDCLADLLRMCPQQPDALHEMAELFAARGNPKRALECIEDALIVRSDDPRLFASMARYLESLDRIVEARQAADDALQLDPDDLELQRLRARLG